MRKSSSSASLAFALLATACGPSEVDPAEFEADAITIACERAFDCCDATELREEFAPFGRAPATFEECVTLLRGRITGEGITASVGAERAAYDADAARSCIDSIGALTCAEYRGGVLAVAAISGACGEALTALVPVGGLCTQDYECQTGFCETGGIGDGNCEPIPGPGEPCTYRCTEGYYCTRGSCEARLADGAACNAADECQSRRCEGADPRAGIQGVCAPLTGYCDGTAPAGD
ncbi:hypothetical protein [Sandaracinus amylolyticus]|uniref:hypothetical protein n=1 Tax=Sandaracinus amylolyticus TaxID=927083 RepID=UPI001F3A1DAD|nr:hypothetical protein [Sandaracinus amylolyticus]UJR86374.1 Hypothetical protein I5071_84690 [Sandaracinus amylolyticus]